MTDMMTRSLVGSVPWTQGVRMPNFSRNRWQSVDILLKYLAECLSGCLLLYILKWEERAGGLTSQTRRRGRSVLGRDHGELSTGPVRPKYEIDAFLQRCVEYLIPMLRDRELNMPFLDTMALFPHYNTYL